MQKISVMWAHFAGPMFSQILIARLATEQFVRQTPCMLDENV